MNRLENVFKNGKAFIPFITCGYPDIQTSEKLVASMAESGADLIELGIPFSDPTAEGEVIAHASQVALQNATTTDSVFEMITRVRKNESEKVRNVALAIMTYANIVYAYGVCNFLRKAQELGICALILPDVPFEEKDEFALECQKFGVELIAFIAPTSQKRIEQIVKEARGFVYCVSSFGVTGVRESITTDIKKLIDSIKQVKDIPVAVGFGIQSSAQAQQIASYADGVIVGSAIVKLCVQYGADSPQYVAQYVKDIKSAITKDN